MNHFENTSETTVMFATIESVLTARDSLCINYSKAM